MRISEHFKLNKTQYELDFIDVELDSDIPLFIDPFYLGTCDYAWAIDANRTLENFFQLLIKLLDSKQLNEARLLFSHLNEPNETRLGLSKGNPQGRGVGPIDTEKIFENLAHSRAIQTGVVSDIEDFRIFVPGIDKDKMSDLTTNIIKKHLISYTQSQCRLWNIPTQPGVPSGFYWDRVDYLWKNEFVDHLIINNEKVLLVPKRIVSYSKEYTPQKYLQHFVLNFLQQEHLSKNSKLVQVRRNKRGRIIKRYVTKKSIISDLGHITKDYLADFSKRHPRIFEQFKLETRSSVRHLGNQDIPEDILKSLIDYLIRKLDEIIPGDENANEYHSLVVGILELIFFPHLTSPQVERKIHEGRKRIDITFDNAATNGFFHRLPTTYQIPSQFIMVECKNYSSDPRNPELDQLSGRFSPNRGKFGLLLCRNISNMNRFLRRCRDTYHDQRGLIIPLIDDDLIGMLMDLESNGTACWESLLSDRYRYIALS